MDVAVDNAGYGQIGRIEELSETEIRAQLETSLWAPYGSGGAAVPA